MLPSVDAVLRSAEAHALRATCSAAFLAATARALLDGWRDEIRSGALDAAGLQARIDRAGAALAEAVQRRIRAPLVAVVNATGVVVHTNLGRSPWPERVVA